MKSGLNIPLFRVIGSPKVITGFIHGLRYPSLVVLLAVDSQKSREWQTRFDSALSGLLQNYPGDTVRPEQEDAVRSLLYWMSRLQQAAGGTVFEEGKIIGHYPESSSVLIAIPVFSSSHNVTGQVFFRLMNVFNGLAAGRDISAYLQELPVMVKQLEQTVPCSPNMPRFLRAAFKIRIPCSEFAGQVYQFGYGVRARLLDSTFTDKTSNIGSRLARMKTLTAEVLRRAGIPVSDHITVTDVHGAEKAAYKLGFPVVVKPADLDGGIGVAAGLTTPEEVRKAFDAAQKRSKNILVEKHVDGRDHRLTVFQGELVSAVERVPGGVTGDGSSTVQTLLDRLNGDINRGDGPHSLLKRIVVDDEAKSLLEKAGKSLESVPCEGEFVRLRRIANVACGGMPVAVLEHVHPDNRVLAVRAAAALRLDLAGVDLLIPDISRSWRESGAVVCEVNAQPSLGGITSSHLYENILLKLVQGSGRIPIAVVIGASPEWNMAEAIATRLGDAGLVAGRVDHEGVSIGTLMITGRSADPYTGGRILTGDKGVAAVVFCLNDTSVLRTGLPFERFDLLVIAGSHISMPAGQSGQSGEVQLRALFDFVSPGCDGRVMLVTGPGMEVPSPLLSLPEELRPEHVAKSQAVALIAEAMIEAEGKHRREQPSGSAQQLTPASVDQP